MVTFKYRWMTAFGVSLTCHMALIILIGIIAAVFPHEQVDRRPIEVDLVSLSGGGGGGGGSADGVGEGVPQINSPAAVPTETPSIPDEVNQESTNDVHQITDHIDEKQTESAVSPSDGSTDSKSDASGGNRGYGSGTGFGGGHGSGVGTGTGSGTGPGTGFGSGGGNGSGTGTGTGEGSGDGGVTMGPQILSAPAPAYPESARAANAEGTTVVGLIIGVSGNVSSAWIESSSGNGMLDQAAVNAVYGWHFVPAKQNGIAIEAQSRVPVSFTLR